MKANGSFLPSAFRPQPAPMLSYDALGDRKPQSGTLPFAVGEKRLENPLAHLLRDAVARIGEAQLDLVVRPASRHCEGSTLGHGVAGVRGKIVHHLRHAVGVHHHLSTVSPLADHFNHVLLDPSAYAQYVERTRPERVEFQGGARYIELDLFSRLRTSDYVRLYRESGFVVESLILEICPAAVRFRRSFPKLWREIMRKNPQCTEDDFVIKSNLVRLRKPG